MIRVAERDRERNSPSFKIWVGIEKFWVENLWVVERYIWDRETILGHLIKI